ncbi:MAG: fibronectin type III domain-containing protein [Verrucomicrobia bacterium]|nr:fibronectin type III domain-containing protein [Verrucomicrobiota bacterium]
MENKISSSAAQLLPQIAEAIPGVTTHAVAVGLPADMATTMTTQEAALQTAHNQFLDKITELKASHAAKRVALKAGQTLVTLIRETAKPTLGHKYSQEWAAFGFVGSLQVPRSASGMVSILGTLAGHLETHPQFGSDDLNLNAAKTGVLRTNLMAAITAVNVKKSEARQKFDDRAEKAAAVRLRLREVLSALRLKFGPLDGRWSEFGFNKPGALPIPPVPEGVTAVLIGTNAISIKWPAVARAEHCRIWIRVIGVDTELRSVGISSDLDFLLEQLPGNSQVEIALSAVNNGGESGKSAVVVVETL